MAAVGVEMLSRLSVVYDNCAVEARGCPAHLDYAQHRPIVTQPIPVDACTSEEDIEAARQYAERHPEDVRCRLFVADI